MNLAVFLEMVADEVRYSPLFIHDWTLRVIRGCLVLQLDADYNTHATAAITLRELLQIDGAALRVWVREAIQRLNRYHAVRHPQTPDWRSPWEHE